MKQILGSLFKQNHESEYCVPQKSITCDGATVMGIEWMVPDVQNGILKGYRNTPTPGNVKPSPDSVKTIRIMAKGQTLWIAITDDAGVGAYADACNECCENGTPVIQAPTIPDVLMEDNICADVDGNFRTFAPIPALVSGQKVMLAVFTCNGDTAADAPSAGFASAAALLTWVQANYAAFGTWSLQNSTVEGDTSQSLRLISPDCGTTSLELELKRQVWCNTITYPVTYDTIIHNGKTTTLAASNTAANGTELITQVANYFADGLLTAPASNKLRYDGTGAPDRFKLGATNKGIFSAGECVAPTTTTTTHAPTTTTTTTIP